MNVIQAWKAAECKSGVIRRTKDGCRRECSLKEYGGFGDFLRKLLNYECHNEDLLADDWQVVKVKRDVRGRHRGGMYPHRACVHSVEFDEPVPYTAVFTATWEE